MPTPRPMLPLLLLLLALPVAAQSDAEEPGQTSYPSLKIGGFTDIRVSDSDDPGGEDEGFEQGQFVLHFASALAPSFSFFSEVTLTASGSQYNTSVERAIVRYERSDRLKVSFGKYHTPINWWNTAFHHGLWLQTTASRPEMTEFGGLFIPVHFVGGLLEGSIPAGGANLTYMAGVGNGRSTSRSGAGDSGDSNDNRARLVGLSVRPDRLYTLRVGGALYRDRVTLPAGPELRETISSAFVVWNSETPEVILEFAQQDHREQATGARHRSDAFYAQLAWRLPTAGQRLKPYARFEKLNIASADPVLAGLTDKERVLVGLRADIAGYVALKIEYRNDRFPVGPDVGSTVAQASLAF